MHAQLCIYPDRLGLFRSYERYGCEVSTCGIWIFQALDFVSIRMAVASGKLVLVNAYGEEDLRAISITDALLQRNDGMWLCGEKRFPWTCFVVVDFSMKL